MISQPVKDLYYASFGKLSAVSWLWHRIGSAERFADAFVNLGCGRKYVPGMVNVDGNPFCRKDLWLDVTLGLPFRDSSAAGIYASHMVEHLTVKQARKLFAECRRVLKPGGRVRLAVPSLEYAIDRYLRQEVDGLPDWPDSFRSAGGRFNNLMLCANQHRTLFDFSLLNELLEEAGFSSVTREAPGTSGYFRPQHLSFESDPALVECSLYVEAIRR